jgi:two-component system chemotaxis response regulator CheY
MIKATLTRAGFQVVGEAKNGREAAELFMKLKPDLVTMDINMPVLDGAESLREIRKADPGAKILVLTATGYEDLQGQGIQGAAPMTLHKPFRTEDLIEAVNGLLGRT